MLVNARQVRKNADAYLNQLQTYLDKQVCLSAPPPTNGSFKAIAARNGSIDKLNGSLQRVSAGALAAPALADGFLIDSLLVEYPEHLQCYEELQASATIPLTCSEASKATVFDSWSAHMRRRSETGNVIRILSEEKQRVEQELERYYLENEKNKGLAAEKESAEKLRRTLEQEKQSLESKLQAMQQQVQSLEKEVKNSNVQKELAEENDLLLAQLHQVQEELERYYLENEKNKGLAAEKASVENKRQALEAEKKALEQRLKEQQTTVEKENAVQIAKQRALAEEKQSLESKLQAMQQQVQSLEKEVKNSNVQKELTEENGLLLAQLHQVQEELERYYLENQKLKQEQKPAYYGAAERLKSELPYQLGAAIIERSRQVWPVLFLPISLSRIARQYRKHAKASGEQLPPLEAYRDFYEAEKAQKHLSYSLGETWLKHSRTPWGWVVMPFALSRARKAYRQYRQSLDS